jgi:hypothetical protein
MHIGIQERFFRNGPVELARVFEFLDLEPITIEPKKKHVRHYDSPMGPAPESKLMKYYESFNKRLFEFLGEDLPEWRHAWLHFLILERNCGASKQ